MPRGTYFSPRKSKQSAPKGGTPLGIPLALTCQRRQKNLSGDKVFLLCCKFFHIPTCAINHRRKWGHTVGSYVICANDIISDAHHFVSLRFARIEINWFSNSHKNRNLSAREDAVVVSFGQAFSLCLWYQRKSGRWV